MTTLYSTTLWHRWGWPPWSWSQNALSKFSVVDARQQNPNVFPAFCWQSSVCLSVRLFGCCCRLAVRQFSMPGQPLRTCAVSAVAATAVVRHPLRRSRDPSTPSADASFWGPRWCASPRLEAHILSLAGPLARILAAMELAEGGPQ